MATSLPERTRTRRVPGQAEILEAWRPRLMASTVYQKITFMYAKEAFTEGSIETLIDGKLETTNDYRKGDFILHGTEGERYVMAAEKFSARYDTKVSDAADGEGLAREGFRRYKAIGQVYAIQVGAAAVQESFPAGCFMARWGAEMAVEAGDWVVMPAPAADEVYRIEAKAFLKTYNAVESEATKLARELHTAVRKHDAEGCRQLLAANADVNAPLGADGRQPAHVAARCGDAPLLQLLLDEGARLDATSATGYTPLMEAARCGSRAAAETLVAAGAQIERQNMLGKTAARLADDYAHKDVAALLASAASADGLELIKRATPGHARAVVQAQWDKRLVEAIQVRAPN